MSSDVLSRVLALHNKADELARKGHLLRAAENYGCAAEAARSLGVDNLVMLHMQMCQGSCFAIYVAKATKFPDKADPDTVAELRTAFVTLFFGAVEALERRRVASTLFEGKCAAVEEVWFSRRCLQWQLEKPNTPAGSVGYWNFLEAATDVLYLLATHDCVAGCSDVQLQSFVQHVVHAGEWMQQPRQNNTTGPLQVESAFAALFDSAVDELTQSIVMRWTQP